MRAYGKNLRWIMDRQYGDECHTGIAMPSSGRKRGQRRKRYKRSFKEMERQWAKGRIRKEQDGG